MPAELLSRSFLLSAEPALDAAVCCCCGAAAPLRLRLRRAWRRLCTSHRSRILPHALRLLRSNSRRGCCRCGAATRSPCGCCCRAGLAARSARVAAAVALVCRTLSLSTCRDLLAAAPFLLSLLLLNALARSRGRIRVALNLLRSTNRSRFDDCCAPRPRRSSRTLNFCPFARSETVSTRSDSRQVRPEPRRELA